MMGYDLMIQAMSGLMSLTGAADGPAYRAGISVFDIVAGLHLIMGILAALHERTTSGEGQHVGESVDIGTFWSRQPHRCCNFGWSGSVPDG